MSQESLEKEVIDKLIELEGEEESEVLKMQFKGSKVKYTKS